MSLVLILALVGCHTAEPKPDGEAQARCTPAQPAPYADGVPYLGIHADAGNSDVVGCATASSYKESWHALVGMGPMQPNTFSPDGEVTYVTTTNPAPEGCRLHALDLATGDPLWCRSYPAEIGQSAVEVDSKGDLYLSVAGAVLSLDAQGKERWRTELTHDGEADAAWGVHFTPDGHVATVTSAGVVYLFDRSDGRVLASLSIADTWGFVPPATLDLDVDITALLPEAVVADIAAVWGDPTADDAAAGLGGFLGASAFVDNTLAVAADGRIYVIGGGPDPDHGALVQVNVDGSPDAPTLSPGWAAVTVAGSASSPSVSRTARFVTIADGASTAGVLAPDTVDAGVRIADIEACDNNTDADPDPAWCAFSTELPVERAPLPGAPAILDDGAVVFYEFGLDFSADADDRDLVLLGTEGVRWEVALPGDLDWNSVVTVTDNHVIGTASKVSLSDESLLGLSLPATTDDRLVVLDREDGSLVFEAAIPDDSSATVTVGPDGALYVGMLGLISVLAVDDRPTLGLMRFAPVD